MGSEQAVTGGVRTPQPHWTPGDASHAPFWTLWTAQRTMVCSPALLCLLWDRQARADAGLDSAWLAGGNVFCFSPIYLCSVSYWLHGQWQHSTITAKTIIHNLFQIHQKYPYVFSTSTGFGTRNRIAGLPLNSTALLIQKPLMDIKCFVIDDDVLLNSPSINHFSECVGFSAFIAEYFSATKYSFFACLHFFQGVALLLGFQHQTLLNNSTPNKDFLCWWHMEPVLK